MSCFGNMFAGGTAALLLSLSLTARADEAEFPANGDVMGLHLYSVHSHPGFEDVTPGAYYRWANGIQVGALRNSYRKTSVYGGYLLSFDDARRFGLFVGAISGYEDANGKDVVPLVAPQVGLELSPGVWARLAWFINPGANEAQAFHFSLERQFGVTSRSTAPAENPVGGVRALIGVGLSSGGDKLVQLTYEGATTQHLSTGGRFMAYAGGEWRASERVDVQATVGYHLSDTTPLPDTGLRFARVPVNLVGYYRLSDAWRLGVGVEYAARPRVSGTGAANGVRRNYQGSVGAVVETEYLFMPQMGVKLRYADHRFTPEGGGDTAGGRYGALMLTYYF